MTEWEKDWRENYKTLRYNADTDKEEMMSLNEYQAGKHDQKFRCKSVLKDLRQKIAMYESWKVELGPTATEMDWKVRLLREDLVAWTEYAKRLFASKPEEPVELDPKYPRHYYFD